MVDQQQSFLRSSSNFIRFHSFRLPPSSPSSASFPTGNSYEIISFETARLPATQCNFRTTKSSLRIPFTGYRERTAPRYRGYRFSPPSPSPSSETDENMDFVILMRPCERNHEWHEHGHGSISKPILGSRGSRA